MPNVVQAEVLVAANGRHITSDAIRLRDPLPRAPSAVVSKMYVDTLSVANSRAIRTNQSILSGLHNQLTALVADSADRAGVRYVDWIGTAFPDVSEAGAFWNTSTGALSTFDPASHTWALVDLAELPKGYTIFTRPDESLRVWDGSMWILPRGSAEVGASLTLTKLQIGSFRLTADGDALHLDRQTGGEIVQYDRVHTWST